MPGIKLTVGHLHAVRWKQLDEEDFHELRRTLAELHRATGKAVIYMAVQDNQYREPTPQVQKLVKAAFTEMMAHCTADYLVLTATGVMASLQKSALKALVATGRAARVEGVDKVVVLSSVEEVLEREKHNLPEPLDALRARLKAAGITDT